MGNITFKKDQNGFEIYRGPCGMAKVIKDCRENAKTWELWTFEVGQLVCPPEDKLTYKTRKDARLFAQQWCEKGYI